MDNVGKINADTTRNYYLKDHLGSIRVVLNSTNTVISAQDYDAWGYPLENRTYNATAMKYDFTGKERDNETNYEYFGARYYDSRIANWTSIDPLFEKHFDYSPYNYVWRNPIRLIDPDGRQVEFNKESVVRNQELDWIKKTLEPQFRPFIGIVEDNSRYLLDVNLLESANVNYSTDAYHRLLDLATSSETTKLIAVAGETIMNFTIASNGKSDYGTLGDEFSGYTLYSGKHINSEPNTFLST